MFDKPLDKFFSDKIFFLNNKSNRMESDVNKPPFLKGEDIVISGISGRFPESDNVDEFAKNLYNNVDMITEDDRRWPLGQLILISSIY